ncbi:type IX secretion system plug protein [Polluticaenibacter yanchengensis]|uniref:DUF5103 domain-containing protein n=1 Tax=Polluticaenibacter yanchengensis TaxID=3014562 RepID=A0ABT4UHN9_9BACT|nr:DUF5103 domain-containing protein [Chitinophagaceae bacterium LY-5]
MRIWLLLLMVLGFSLEGNANVGEIRMNTIHTVKLFKDNDQITLPIIKLNEIESLELHFDDLSNNVKNFYYTLELCNADWQPAILSQMDYLKGFSQNRITTYRNSSIAETRYVHYQIKLPQNNMLPTRSGNYLLKVFLNGDTSQLAFTKPFMVVDPKVAVGAQIQLPFNQIFYKTHQKVVVNINTQALDVYNPQQQLRVVILQNNRWDDARTAAAPTFIRGKEFEYSNEDKFVFEAGKENRWIDLRSFRFLTERVRAVDKNTKPITILAAPDTIRAGIRYILYNDLNGQYEIAHLEGINNWWQTDYANVIFSFFGQNRTEEFNNRKIYLMGEFTNYDLTPENEMKWNEDINAFQTTKLLKNGFYNYFYVTTDKNGENPTMQFTEGNNWETENKYTILVYFKGFSGRHDELVGVNEINTRNFLNLLR